MNMFDAISAHIKSLPEGEPITPYIKPILLLGPEQGAHAVVPQVKDLIRSWSEPYPTVAEMTATRDLYESLPDPWSKLSELFSLLILNCALRQLKESMK